MKTETKILVSPKIEGHSLSVGERNVRFESKAAWLVLFASPT
jgi:hypothetical protein